MKKTLIALAAVAVSGAAFAQSTVVLSGGLSMGLKQLNNVNTIAGVDNVNSNSLIATVSEDLGGGLRAMGVVQLRINNSNNTGSPNAFTTTGDMFVQLSGGFGAVRLGQFTFNSHAGFNPFASRAATGAGTVAQSFTNQNTVMYTSPNFSGFTVSGAINLDTSAGTNGKNGTGLKLNYAQGPLSVQAATTTQTRTAPGVKTTTNALAARYNFGVAIADANWYSTKTGSATTARGYMLGASVPVDAFTFRVAMHRNSLNNGAVDRNAIGVDYALSKRTTLIAEFSSDKNAVDGLNKRTNHFIGVAHTF